MRSECFSPDLELQIPIIPRVAATVEKEDHRRLRRIAAELAQDDPHLNSTEAFGRKVQAGIGAGPFLVIGDTREIALAKQGRETSFEYRLSLLARQGDAVLFSKTVHADFDHYRAETLGLGNIHPIYPQGQGGRKRLPLAERCLNDPNSFDEVASITKDAGGLTLVPHIGMGSAWYLAGALARATGVPVHVASAPPRLTRRANDKLWFAQLITKTLGPAALPPTFAAHSLAALASRMRLLARNSRRIVVKVPDSAGSAGNISLDACDICDLTLGAIRDRIIGMLFTLGWRDTFPLLVGLWETPALSSPSVQMWIPPISFGPPLIEGIFEQILEGTEGAFAGSVPADLPADVQRRLAMEATRIGTVLQHCGYFGRCSLDALLVGDYHEDAELHWIECNGRWGGVSIPMTIVSRLFGLNAPRFVVTQKIDRMDRPLRFLDALQRLDDILLKPGRTKQGIMFLSPVEIEAGRGVQMVACAKTSNAARELSRHAEKRLFA